MASSSKKPVKGEQHRPPDAKAAKVDTTWEEQCQLAERLRGLGVTCKACLQGPWCHKPHDGGKSCYKYMLAAGTASSSASIKDMRKEGESAAARVSAPLGETAPTASKSRPLSQLVRFETKEGTVLLFEPHPLDSWIDRECAWNHRKQVYMDLDTGDQLTEAEGEDYQRYLQRHKERRHLGGQADELVKLAAKINPRTVVELRFYIAKFPWEVSRLLGEGKALYKEMSKQRHGGETAQTAVLQKKEKPDKQKHKKAKEGKTSKKDKRSKKAKHNHDNSQGEDLPSTSTAVEPEEKKPVGDAENEVDWGGSDVDDKQPNTASPHDAGGSHDDDDPATLDTTSLRTNWPWGERGRPSDTASASSGIGAQRPRTPSRSPRRRGTDMWHAIKSVQRHMKNARGE